ncbi:proline--tRNA ligase [Halovenus sp. HT40]|uniref:proline--tRNA ligase n=1 Tax=Halovenus sp. HT40 TaxID=3126691 RepID=UPI00300F5EFD
MRRSDLTLFTSREPGSQDKETVKLALRAGLIRQFGSGLYGFAPTGQRIRQRIIDHVDREMRAIGAREVSLPQLNYSGMWEESGRWGEFGGEMFSFENRDGKRMCLAPSHEEGIVHLLSGTIRSYEDLPGLYYQISRKHRDDHARGGLLRTKEFTMKDAYSVHATADSLDEQYERVREAYFRVFEDLDIDFVIADAENNLMGGSASEEFLAVAETGTADLWYCPEDDCRFGVTNESPRSDLAAGDDCPDCGGTLVAGEGVEIGHIFKLGTRYSEPMGLTVDLADGSRQDVLMASYGIGIERLLYSLIEQHADDEGCRWSADGSGIVAPYAASIIPLQYDDELAAVADYLYEDCGADQTLLFDDPDQSIGERFAESDLLGVPYKIIVGNEFRETGEVELESRDGETEYVTIEAVPERI